MPIIVSVLTRRRSIVANSAAADAATQSRPAAFSAAAAIATINTAPIAAVRYLSSTTTLAGQPYPAVHLVVLPGEPSRWFNTAMRRRTPSPRRTKYTSGPSSPHGMAYTAYSHTILTKKYVLANGE